MTILFSLCYLNEEGRLERNLEWLNYMKPLQKEFGFDRIVLVDNASDGNLLLKLHANIYEAKSKKRIHSENGSIVDVYRYDEHLPRAGMLDYPYCWRGMKFAQELFKEEAIRKIQFIDTDFYVLSKRMANYFRDETSGWVSFHCKKYNFPEAALQVLCRDEAERFCNFPIPNFTHYSGLPMEKLLPFTEIKTNFVGDRYGEDKLKQAKEIDYYGQWNINCDKMIFEI